MTGDLLRSYGRKSAWLWLLLGLVFSCGPVEAAGVAGAVGAAGAATTAQVAGPAPVAAPPARPDPASVIRQKIESRFPGTHVLEVKPSAINGLYELFLGDQIVYTDPSADYLLMGPLVDTQTHENLTDASLSDRGRIDFASLPLDRAIKIVKGNGSRRFAVFSDPDCPFCKKLEQSLTSVTDFTMYVFLFPIAALHPQAPAKAHAIWCAKNRTEAWNQWMHEQKLPPGGLCAGDPVSDLQKLGDKLRINSTPTIFFADGRRVAGAIPTSDLEKLLTASNAGRR